MTKRQHDLVMEWLMPNVALRYFPVLGILRAVLAETVLDVGCGDGGLGMFGWQGPLVGCDLHFGSAMPPMRPVVGKGGALPFRAKAFDAVISLDTLEHVPPEERAPFIGDLVRVARRYVVLAMPCGRVGRWTEKVLDGWYGLRGISTPPWLEEHVALSLPELNDIEVVVAGLGHPYTVFGNVNALAHLAVMVSESSPKLRPRLVRFTKERMELAARIAGWLNARPTYRHLFLIDVTGDHGSALAETSGRT